MSYMFCKGVETEKCPSMKMAIKNDEPFSVEIRSTLADGLAVPTVGYNAFHTVKPLIDQMVNTFFIIFPNIYA